MKRKRGEAERYVAQLADVPARLVAIASLVTAGQARQQPGPKAWSLRQLLVHLEACSVVWQQGVRTLLDHDEPAIEFPHPGTIMFTPALFVASFREAAERYQQERSAFLALFDSCDEAVFDRAGTINGRRQTVFEQIRRLAKHEVEHQPQLDDLVQATGITIDGKLVLSLSKEDVEQRRVC